MKDITLKETPIMMDDFTEKKYLSKLLKIFDLAKFASRMNDRLDNHFGYEATPKKIHYFQSMFIFNHEVQLTCEYSKCTCPATSEMIYEFVASLLLCSVEKKPFISQTSPYFP